MSYIGSHDINYVYVCSSVEFIVRLIVSLLHLSAPQARTVLLKTACLSTATAFIVPL